MTEGSIKLPHNLDRQNIANRVNALQNAVNNWGTLTPAQKDNVLLGLAQAMLVLANMFVPDQP